MKSRSMFIIAGVVSVLAVLAFVSLSLIRGEREKRKAEIIEQQKKMPTQTKPFIVALISPELRGVRTKVREGLTTTLKAKSPLNFTIKDYVIGESAQEAERVRAVEQILDEHVDMIVTVGSSVTKVAKQVTAQRHNKTPIVFCRVKDPIAINLIESPLSSGNNLTGVTAVPFNYEQQAALLTTLKPSVKGALIVYNPEGKSGEKAKETLQQALETQGVDVNSIGVSDVESLTSHISKNLLKTTDAIVMIQHPAFITKTKQIAELCSKRGVVLYTNNLDDIEQGAGLTYGVDESQFGVVVAQSIIRLLHESKKPSEVPLVIIEEPFRLLINSDVMEQQGLNIDPYLMFLIQDAYILDDVEEE